MTKVSGEEFLERLGKLSIEAEELLQFLEEFKEEKRSKGSPEKSEEFDYFYLSLHSLLSTVSIKLKNYRKYAEKEKSKINTVLNSFNKEIADLKRLIRNEEKFLEKYPQDQGMIASLESLKARLQDLELQRDIYEYISKAPVVWGSGLLNHFCKHNGYTDREVSRALEKLEGSNLIEVEEVYKDTEEHWLKVIDGKFYCEECEDYIDEFFVYKDLKIKIRRG